MDRFLMIFFAGVLLAPTAAQSNPDYPNKPVRIIVNVAPGGGVDTATRIIADKLRARLGQPFVVENRPGAGGNIGAEVVFQSEGDGYTLLASSPTPLAINGWLYKKLAFDPAGFEPVAMMSRIPNVLERARHVGQGDPGGGRTDAVMVAVESGRHRAYYLPIAKDLSHG